MSIPDLVFSAAREGLGMKKPFSTENFLLYSKLGFFHDSAVKQRGRERKGPPEIIQKFRLRKWPISSAYFPVRLLWKEQSPILALFRRRIFGPISGGPIVLPAPL